MVLRPFLAFGNSLALGLLVMSLRLALRTGKIYTAEEVLLNVYLSPEAPLCRVHLGGVFRSRW